MGCTISSNGTFDSDEYREAWTKIESAAKKPVDKSSLIIKHNDYRTVRLFVASTFKDFKNERRLLYSKLVPALESLCKSKKLLFVLEDFIAGNKEPPGDPESIYSLVDALEQCYADSACPFYLHLLGECSGYILPPNYPDSDTAATFGLLPGMSLMESAVTIGALRMENPNALFMYRDPKFLNAIPFHQVQFIEEDAGRTRAKFIREKLQAAISPNRFITYRCSAEGLDNPHHHQMKLKKLDKFIGDVVEFFKLRVTEQYTYRPISTEKQPSKWKSIDAEQRRRVVEITEEMNSSGPIKETVEKVVKTLSHASSNSLTVVTGDYGVGKTTALAHLVLKLLPKESSEASVKSPDGQGTYKVFYHFATRSFNSDCVETMLERLLHDIYKVKEETLPGQPEDLRAAVRARLMNPKGPPVIIVVDDLDTQSLSAVNWIPEPMPSQVKVIIGTQRDATDKTLRHLTNKPEFIRLPYLGKDDAKVVITRYLRHISRGVIGEKRVNSSKMNARPQTAGRRLVADELTNLLPLKRTALDTSTTDDSTTTLGMRIMSAGYNNLRRRSSKGDGKIDVEAGIAAGAGVQAVKGPAVDEGKEKERKADFTVTKCKILSTMLRFGVPLEKVKALAYFGTVSVAEAELMELESELSGHLLIATLCLLVAAKRGLREIELRHLLANEASLLPEGFKRRTYNTGYAFADPFGSMVQPVRWRYVIVRLAHHIVECGEFGENRLIIADAACRKAIERRYFSKKGATDGKWWAQQLANFFGSDLYFLTERKAEELPYHAAIAGDSSLVERGLTDWAIVRQLYRNDYSHELLQLWKKGTGDSMALEKSYTQLVLGNDNKWTAQELQDRVIIVANILKQAENYSAAAKIAQKAIEIEKGIDGGRPLQIGKIYSLLGDIQHEKGRTKNALLEWVDWNNSSQQPYVTQAYDAAVECLKPLTDNSQAKALLAHCYMRLAFWQNYGAKAHSTSSGVAAAAEASSKAALALCNNAKEIFSEQKNKHAEGECCLIIAACEQREDKIQDALTKAEERFKREAGPFSADLLRAYALGVKLLPGGGDYATKAKELNYTLHHANDKDRFTAVSAQLAELSRGSAPVAVDL
uniref:NACHT domain-containing protein n=1 Tax=Plectus sambesii TaxID=2011161 RepID=A0A914WQ84_9BILA